MALPDGLLYRPLCQADFPALSRILPPLLPGEWSEQALQGLLASPHYSRVLQGSDLPAAAVAGFAEFTVVADECEILSLAVDPHRQGRGMGRALLRAVLAEARDLGCLRCFLEVRRSNAVAIALYASEGFVLQGVRKGYYAARQPQHAAEDALLYSLNL